MIHPFFTTLLTRPELLAGHLGAYVELAAVEASASAQLLRARLAWLGLLVVSLGLGLGLTGVALLLLACWPWQQMPLPWLLIVVPAVPLALALLSWLQLQRRTPRSFEGLRQQLALDRSMLQEAGRP